MIVFILVLVAAIVFGLYFIISALLKLPIKSKIQKKYHSKKSLDMLTSKIARKYIEPHIKMNAQKHIRLTRALEVTNNQTTASLYQANAYVKSAVVFLFGIAGLFVNGFVSLLAFVLSIMVYFNHFHSLYRLCDQYKVTIDNEMPAFASYIKEKLASERNAIKLLDEYTLTDNEVFARELEITIASMRTSSPENGLLQLNRRVSSEKLNMIIQGLLGVVRGEDQQFYFQMISYDFDVMDKNNLRKRVSNMPKKLNPYMFLLFAAVLVEFMTPILIDISKYIGEFFK